MELRKRTHKRRSPAWANQHRGIETSFLAVRSFPAPLACVNQKGLFLATLTGPGEVWLQSLPFSRLAGRMLAGATTKSKDEGSLLGGLAGIGGMFMGDQE